MRTMDRKDAIQHEADELAAEAFGRYPRDVEQWVRDAFVGEWGANAEDASKQVMWAAVKMVDAPNSLETRAAVIRAVGDLRMAYVELASERGLYAAEAEDAINTAISDEAERLQDLAEHKAVDAYQSGLRG